MTQPEHPEPLSEWLKFAQRIVVFQEGAELQQYRELFEHLSSETSIQRFLRRLNPDTGIDFAWENETGAMMVGQIKRYSQPTLADVRAADRFMRSYLRRAADNPDEVEAAAVEVAADPEQRKKVARVASFMKRPEVTTLSQWALVLIATLLLLHIFGLLPVENVSAVQDSVDGRLLGVLGIALALAAFVKSSHD